jgi:uncharacterized protein YegP (UPF0339 family)
MIRHQKVCQEKSGHVPSRLRAANGGIITVSEGNISGASWMRGIERVKKNDPTARVVGVKEC